MIDLNFLKKFTKGDTIKMKRYISLYLDVASRTIEDMQVNIENEDWKKVRISAHSLKPQTDFMGISSLKNVLIEIEEAVKKNDFDTIHELFIHAREISYNATIMLRNILIELK